MPASACWRPWRWSRLRLIQGLALGGEYGGAATYVAEHAPPGRRGFYTSWIQTTATAGLFLSLVVILFTRLAARHRRRSPPGAGGCRSCCRRVLLGVSLWIRLRLNESPVFQRLVKEGKTSRKPLTDAFANKRNLKLVILALVGLTAGQAVVWYTGQFYALFFLEKILKVDGALTNQLVAMGLAIGTPFIVLFGWLSDKIGRKPIILGGCLLAALTYFPLFHALTAAANPGLAAASHACADHRHRRSRRLRLPVRSGGQGGVQLVLRHRQILSGPGRPALSQ